MNIDLSDNPTTRFIDESIGKINKARSAHIDACVARFILDHKALPSEITVKILDTEELDNVIVNPFEIRYGGIAERHFFSYRFVIEGQE